MCYNSDRQIQVKEIAQALGISHGSVSTILHDGLVMHKLTACWVPKSLSDEQMAIRASVCSALLKRFRPGMMPRSPSVILNLRSVRTLNP